jgi:DNA-binding response OmpR family regulator
MTNKKRILLTEDDHTIAKLLTENLEFEGFSVAWAATGADALAKSRTFAPDLILLDLMLPDRDGLDLCRTFANSKDHVPVIVITAKGQQEDRVRGLTLGADDYVVKPFALEELLARIKAVLRRTKGRVERITLGPVTIDFVRLRAYKNAEELVLTDREFEIMRYLAERAGSIVSRDELLHLVWGYNQAPMTRTVDNFIFRLRQKIEEDPHHPKYLRKSYGDGYRLTLDGQ